MILIVTNRQDQTADFLIVELRKRGAAYTRFNTEDFPRNVRLTWQFDNSVVRGHIVFPKARVDFDDIQSIWYRRPVSSIPAASVKDSVAHEFVIAESQAALEGVFRTLDCFWVSHPDKLRIAEYKLYQLQVASQLGFRTPSTIVTTESDQAEEFYHTQLRNIIYKPLRQGRLMGPDGLELIYTNPVGKDESERFAQVSLAPSMFQRYVEKKVEIRVTVIRQKVFAVEIHSQQNNSTHYDWRHENASILHHQPHSLPAHVETKCIRLVKQLGLAFGAIDLVLTPDNEYIFLEINPNGQWAWLQQLCPEVPLRETLADLLVSGPLMSDE